MYLSSKSTSNHCIKRISDIYFRFFNCKNYEVRVAATRLPIDKSQVCIFVILFLKIVKQEKQLQVDQQ